MVTAETSNFEIKVFERKFDNGEAEAKIKEIEDVLNLEDGTLKDVRYVIYLYVETEKEDFVKFLIPQTRKMLDGLNRTYENALIIPNCSYYSEYERCSYSFGVEALEQLNCLKFNQSLISMDIYINDAIKPIVEQLKPFVEKK